MAAPHSVRTDPRVSICSRGGNPNRGFASPTLIEGTDTFVCPACNFALTGRRMDGIRPRR